MKRQFLVAAFAMLLITAATAQTRKAPPPPAPPPPPPVEMVAPPAPPPPPMVDEDPVELPADYQAFLKQNPSVRSVGWRKGFVIIHKKNGQTERYATTEEGTAQAEAKYGKLPVAPPPPPLPPAPPMPPTHSAPPPPPPAPPKPMKNDGDNNEVAFANRLSPSIVI